MLTIYTLEQSKEWDAVVHSFQKYDVYWLSGYVKAFHMHGDGNPLLFYYEGKTTRGINVVMKRDISEDSRFVDKIEKGEFYDFSTPYGYGGWIVEGDEREDLFKEYEQWCFKENIISEFVRFHPVLGNQQFSEDNYEVIPLGNTIAMDLSSEEVIWANLTSKNRNMIRKAERNDIKIYRGQYPDIYHVFREIYNKTMDKDQADSYYYFKKDFYESMLNDLLENAQIFYAVYEDQIIAASIMLTSNGHMNYHLSGSLQEYAYLAPSNLLLYKAALWGSTNGCKTLYLGGGVGGSEDNLFKFKKSFYRKEDLKRFYIGKKIFNQDKYKDLVSMSGVEQSNFFPQYRA